MNFNLDNEKFLGMGGSSMNTKETSIADRLLDEIETDGVTTEKTVAVYKTFLEATEIRQRMDAQADPFAKITASKQLKTGESSAPSVATDSKDAGDQDDNPAPSSQKTAPKTPGVETIPSVPLTGATAESAGIPSQTASAAPVVPAPAVAVGQS